MTLRQKWAITAIAVIVVAVVYTLCNPLQRHWPLQCPFRLLTGLQCPGCGVQRAAYALLHGHLTEALRYNLFLVYAGPYALSLVVENLLPDGRAHQRLKHILENRWVVWFYVVTFCVWLVVRNLLHI
jgi:hypothetical protein